MDLYTFFFFAIGMGVPVAFVATLLVMARRQTKGLDDALRRVGVHK